MNSHFTLLFKILTLGGLILVMLIPMLMIMGLIQERFYYQNSVIDSVAQSSSGVQKIIGPIIVVPYTETLLEVNNKQNYYIQKKYVRYILPQQLNVEGDADISSRHIGIYQAQVYQTQLTFNGSFNSVSLDSLKNNPAIEVGEPYLLVLISDTRGIMQTPTIMLANQQLDFEPGVKQSGMGSVQGINASVSIDNLTNKKLEFNFSLQLQGTKELSIVPIGRSSHYQLKGNWPHPNFIGYSLPINRQIDQNGFVATWQSSWYANNINSLFADDVSETRYYSSDIANMPDFKTSFVETVDQYQMIERAVKYDILFIALTFICFFIFEMLKQLKIHPVQYLLVGMALTLFYLLLLALSEHIGFLLAYIIGSIACSLLIGFYLSGVIKNSKWSIIFTIFLLTLYTVLYFVMISEGNALLLGSILLFIVLGGIMILTRKMDWYKISQVNVEKITTITQQNEQTH
ncbi:cell envelope integrity protein CreD [Orbus mooreae]|uniref:cell envelope integrity protein CreD n=1 Tax=Orbus mooreae TaxID=3074107 RepID=UPI00370DA59D